MHITNISEAKAQLSALVEKVLAGQEVISGRRANQWPGWCGIIIRKPFGSPAL
jgi:hypothetical protein